MGSSESLRQPTPMSAKSRLRVDSAIKAAMERINSPIPTNPSLSRASSSSAFTFMATELDASHHRLVSPEITDMKKVVNRKLTPHATSRKSSTNTSHDNDDDDDNFDYNIPRGMPIESEKVVVESSLDNVKSSWMLDNSGLFNSPGNDNDDDDSDDEDLYGAPISPYKK